MNQQSCDLAIKGMVCGACVSRVESALSRVPGVAKATVNLATERAQIVFDAAQANLASLIDAVEIAGFDAVPADQRTVESREKDRSNEIAGLRRSLLFSARHDPQHGIQLPYAMQSPSDEMEAQGQTVVCLAVNGEAAAIFAVADELSPTTREAITEFRNLGLTPVMVTGDNPRAAQAMAAAAGIDEVIAQVLPGEKASQVQHRQARGEVVAMVGDGVNDAPALAQADVGIAMGSATDVAIEAGHIALLRSDLRGAAQTIRLARATLRTIRQNLFWAFIYNVAGIPLAASGRLGPMLVAAAMAFSSVSVVGNSLRLRKAV
jgi:cation transport ATPase